MFQQALNQNVLVATPTTLLTSLNIVRQLWRYEEQHKHTAELAKRADAVFNKLRTFLTTFLRVKESLNKAQEAYETAESQLYKGRANLVKQVNEFKELTPAIQAELPEYFVEKSQIEFDSERFARDKNLVGAIKHYGALSCQVYTNGLFLLQRISVSTSDFSAFIATPYTKA